MEEAVPRDIARAKQAELAEQRTAVESQMARFDTTTIEHEKLIRAITDLIADCGKAHREADDAGRRAYNQAWFERIYVDQDRPGLVTVRPERTEIVEAVQTATIDRPDAPRTRSGPRN